MGLMPSGTSCSRQKIQCPSGWFNSVIASFAASMSDPSIISPSKPLVSACKRVITVSMRLSLMPAAMCLAQEASGVTSICAC